MNDILKRFFNSYKIATNILGRLVAITIANLLNASQIFPPCKCSLLKVYPSNVIYFPRQSAIGVIVMTFPNFCPLGKKYFFKFSIKFAR